MPFKSLRQERKCFAMHDPNWDCHEWASHTNQSKLPEKKKTKKADDAWQGAQDTLGAYAGGIAGGIGGGMLGSHLTEPLAGAKNPAQELLSPLFTQHKGFSTKNMDFVLNALGGLPYKVSPLVTPNRLSEFTHRMAPHAGAAKNTLMEMAKLFAHPNAHGLGTLAGGLGLGAAGILGGYGLSRAMPTHSGAEPLSALLGQKTSGAKGIGGDRAVPTTGPMDATVGAGGIASSLNSLGGPGLTKMAAAQFEGMSKTAQAKVLASKDVPVLVKLALVMAHTPQLSRPERLKLARHIVKRHTKH